ncbi:Hypothetical protein NTJ_10479 [Nesidiocoris tenuis]|uniref:Uncharacterized protein n=1 Tax=Nesidiocoris tenuis TaxID=355587 RepID=A0ABN7B3A6_9HEMI|nr:Hypothetical protein NTJ_10479 [Nesidiocoris tenuis]
MLNAALQIQMQSFHFRTLSSASQQMNPIDRDAGTHCVTTMTSFQGRSTPIDDETPSARLSQKHPTRTEIRKSARSGGRSKVEDWLLHSK